ncbi:MAG: HU family DNA-binding protein [Holosporaceae bacterium]|nr:HU family DNA-binding protein [Holosporaceae bacterium]
MSAHRNIEKTVAIVTDGIINALKEGGRVELRGFGSFSVRERGQDQKGEKVIVEKKRSSSSGPEGR